MILQQYKRTVKSTSVYTLCTLYHSYFKGISANIVLRKYSLTYCCRTLAREYQSLKERVTPYNDLAHRLRIYTDGILETQFMSDDAVRCR
jgi:hypothetical protein